MNKTLATVLTGSLLLGGLVADKVVVAERVNEVGYTRTQYNELKVDVTTRVKNRRGSIDINDLQNFLAIYNIENAKRKYQLTGNKPIFDRMVEAVDFRNTYE